MASGEIAVHLLPPFQRRLSRRWLRWVVQRTLEEEGVEQPVEVGVVIADDETVRRLNRDYRGRNRVTDVLAFALPYASGGEAFPLPPHQPLSLGEVVISYPQARRQARRHRWRVRREVALLLVHGVLHLLGYDHLQPGEERLMEKKQQAVLASLFPEVAG